ncbi:MAG: helix-turn-helix transcriptional regulator [Gammaproteobacteria bacterium]|jgi:AraC family transcriptional regulator|nr:helix-turn-helix transcriptional regulator [Gammaproteobacteria bacterium]
MEARSVIRPVRAIDALSSAVHVGPILVRESRAFGGLCVCAWKTPWMEGFELPETDELILAYHRGGSHEVRALWGDSLSRSRSTPGLLSLIPPGHRVAYHTGGEVSFTTLHISREALHEVLHLGTRESIHERFAFRDPFVASCIDSLLREARVSDRWSPRFVSAVTEALLLQLLRNSPAEPEVASVPSLETRIAAVRSRLDGNLAGDLSVKALAAEVGLSRAHFARAFRQVVGDSPHRYVMRRRIERAKQLLTESHLALNEIAQEAGFCSQSHLTQIFRTHLGLTPQRYRRKV